MKTKILFIHHATGWGGAPKSLINLIRHFNGDKYEIKVLLIKHSIVADKLNENSISYTVCESKFYKKYYKYFTHSEADYVKWYQLVKFLKHSIFWLLSRLYFAKKELAKQDYDIVHLNSSVLTDWLAPAKKKGKVFIHIREPFRNGRFDLLRFVFRSQMHLHADHIIAISKDNAKRVNLQEKTTVVYNNFDIPMKAPPDASYASRKVLYLGGAATIKGYYSIVDALDYLDEDVTIYFGGYYPINIRLNSEINVIKDFVKHLVHRRQYAAIRKIKDHPQVDIIGLTHNVSDYLNEVCCLVSPFTVPHFARPIIEAYFHKKPVIGTDVEGMDEIIVHEVTGLIVPKNNPEAIAKAINELTRNKKKSKILGETGWKMSLQKFCDNSNQIIELYNKYA
jgi:glycosyltransferase involved in cell wall biosynthesis